jgi:tetratricopeptide (TPR) repeat protein
MNLGNALELQDKFDEAAASYRRAIELKPNYAEAYHSLGNALYMQDSLDDAAAYHRRALALKPDYAEAYVSLGTDLARLEKHEDALDNFHHALALKPDYVEAHCSKAFINLRFGNFAVGWPEYEWRWQLKDLAEVAKSLTMPLWDGKNFQGKTILLYCEQGYGDSIQFIRYAPMVKEKGGKVLLSCPQRLLRLFKNVAGIDEIFPDGTSISACDLRAPLMSLPLLFDTRLDTIPCSVPYLSAPADQAAIWAQRLRPYNGLKVGVVWAGDSRSTAYLRSTDRRRSMSLSQFEPLGSVSGNIHFFSLQKGSPADQAKNAPPGLKLIDFMDSVEDFADTAAFIANLDLVIGVDTSVIHLAGAMGKPVWVLSRFAGCWRWLLKREDSPWYPTLRLFRQPQAGDWSSVIESVCTALKYDLRSGRR